MAGSVQYKDIYQNFGDLVQDLRKTIGYTQTELGSRIGLSRTSVTNIERGHQHVSLHQIYQLAEALEVSPSSLIPERAPFSAQNEELKRLADAAVASWLGPLVDIKEPQQNDSSKKLHSSKG